MLEQLSDLKGRIRADEQPDEPELGLAALRVAAAAVLGIGAIGAAMETASARRSASGYTTSLALAATGILGLVLDRREREMREERARLERRASIVERLVPRRRGRLDHIVVHV
jgi:hypothetical protein